MPNFRKLLVGIVCVGAALVGCHELNAAPPSQVGLSVVGKWSGTSDSDNVIGQGDIDVELMADKTFSIICDDQSTSFVDGKVIDTSGKPSTGIWSLDGRTLRMTLRTVKGVPMPDYKKLTGQLVSSIRESVGRGLQDPRETAEAAKKRAAHEEMAAKKVDHWIARLDQPMAFLLSDDAKVATVDTTNGLFAGRQETKMSFEKM